MNISGQHYYAGKWQADSAATWNSFDPVADRSLPWAFSEATDLEIDIACQAAWHAFHSYRKTVATVRADFLRAIADEILALGETLVDAVIKETGLPRARIEGERGRTVAQLHLFADDLCKPYRPVLVDQAQPERQPLAKHDHRLGSVALGPVAVFGASNFPLAFSVAGGDTASALAAGCPVVVKGHPAHPATSEWVARAIATAAEKTHMPEGVFALLQGRQPALSRALVSHPRISAVGFTGSNKVGLALAEIAAKRAQPIPFYGELGAINPQVILPCALASRPLELAQMQVASMMMGHGQFCTSPGMILVIEGQGLAEYRSALRTEIELQPAAPMLSPSIAETYQSQLANWRNTGKQVYQGKAAAHHTAAALVELHADDLTAAMMTECFGPCVVLVECSDLTQLVSILERLEGQLTASIHADEYELAAHSQVIDALELKVGRLIFNQMPTGVEVCHAMFHGGPYPASTDGRFTSVGSEAIARFTRPICYQNMPDSLRPEALREGAKNQLLW